MLPILKLKKRPVAGLIIKTREPDEKPETEENQEDSTAAIQACAKDLIDAVHAQNVQGVAEALCSAFEILESLPHGEEGPEPHSYDAQNIKAKE